MKLSHQQQDALDRARKTGGLRYVRGGYWVELGVDPEVFRAYDFRDPARPWHTSTQTVQSLVRKGVLAWTDTSPGYPVAAAPV